MTILDQDRPSGQAPGDATAAEARRSSPPVVPVVDAAKLADIQVVSQRAVGTGWLRPAGLVVAVSVPERRRLADVLGRSALAELDKLIAAELTRVLPESRLLARDDAGRHILRLQGARERTERRLALARHEFQNHSFSVAGETLQLTMLVGYVELSHSRWRQSQRHALEALAVAESRGDLVPVAWTPRLVDASTPRPDGWWARHRFSVQLVLSLLIGLGVPYLLYTVAGWLGVGAEVTRTVYYTVSAMMILTTVIIYVEGLLALQPGRPPEKAPPAPAASAVIAAYLPNEAATIVDTVGAFLAQEYSGDLQIVLAYNTPRSLPVEDVLRDMARRDPRLVLLRVDYSTSKAQNVNAALDVVTGDFIGIFDADHHPAQGSFDRAWRWLSQGYGVVQGHCVVRNGDASWVSRLVSVEFEAIYAVSHPGRTQLHGFGVFGGSNGYWRTDLLKAVRMRSGMLTEDIDSSFRVTLRGLRIANDPGLVSRELAPATLNALVHQRLRWAQGWSQVSLRYLAEAFRSTRLTNRQKTGAAFLLGWREVYPWVSLQMWPLLAYALLHETTTEVQWFVPILVLATLASSLAGPSQAALAYVLAAPEIRRHPRWFVFYAVVSALFYVELKNVLARVAHLKEAFGDAEWRVTPREVTT